MDMVDEDEATEEVNLVLMDFHPVNQLIRDGLAVLQPDPDTWVSVIHEDRGDHVLSLQVFDVDDITVTVGIDGRTVYTFDDVDAVNDAVEFFRECISGRSWE